MKKDKNYGEIADERMKYSIHFAENGKTIFYSGEEAKAIRKKMKFFSSKRTADSKDNELKGQTAFPGKVKAKVKIINTIQEMMKMHKGDVLVSHMTNPDIVPAMKMASAIVTDIGGITSHASIVARELKKPCVIGTKIATQILKDGDLIEVDANKGIVRIIK